MEIASYKYFHVVAIILFRKYETHWQAGFQGKTCYFTTCPAGGASQQS